MTIRALMYNYLESYRIQTYPTRALHIYIMRLLLVHHSCPVPIKNRVFKLLFAISLLLGLLNLFTSLKQFWYLLGVIFH